MTEITRRSRLIEASFAIALLSGAGLISGQLGEEKSGSFRFHTDRKVTDAMAVEAAAYYRPSVRPSGAISIDWRLLDRTAVRVSDGVRDADIRYPTEVRALDGQRVSIIGQMNPWQDRDDLTEFVLTTAGSSCVSCSPPPVTLTIHVTQAARAVRPKPPLAPQPVRVTGVLRLFTYESRHPAHLADFLYALDDAVVEIASAHRPASEIMQTPSVFRRKN